MLNVLDKPQALQYHIPLPPPNSQASSTERATATKYTATKQAQTYAQYPTGSAAWDATTTPTPSTTPSPVPSTKPSTNSNPKPSAKPSTNSNTKHSAKQSTKQGSNPGAQPTSLPNKTPTDMPSTRPSSLPPQKPSTKAQKGLLFGVADGNFAAEDLQHFSDNFPSTEAAALHLIAEAEDIPDDIPVQETAGKYVANTKCHPVLPTQQPEEDTAEKHRGLMWPRGIAWEHEAAPLLYLYSTEGCPVDCGPNWSKKQILAAIKRGAHISAKDPEARQYLINTTHDAVAGGFARLVQLKDIIDNLPPNLKVSPIAMIPHKSRAYRGILDLSFALRHQHQPPLSVNEGTFKMAPQKSMSELGYVTRRIVATMAAHYDKNTPFYFAKIDIKDGFWRLCVNKNDAWNFCYTIPNESEDTPIEETWLVVPDALQMGWTESPPYFCVATETARDIIQKLISSNTVENLDQHPLEEKMYSNSPDPPTTAQQPTDPVNLVEVYMDDFILATNELTLEHLKHLSRATLHGVHSIFPPPAVSGHNGEDPISVKKLDQGEGLWHFEKEILGWLFNGVDYTITLPPEKLEKVQALIKSIAKLKSVDLESFQSMAGRLNHATLAIPNGRGLFSPIYTALSGTPEEIKITADLKQALLDWHSLLNIVATRPTHVMELCPKEPDFIGFVDACKYGVGGVWQSGRSDIKPYVWRIYWPKDVRDRLVSSTNPDGDVTINDLEMAGVLLHWLILEQIAPCSLKHRHIGIACDNAASVSWAFKLQSSKSKIAAHLLRALALRQFINQASPLLCTSIAGKHNGMADVASRSFSMPEFVNSPHSFLHVFQNKFPLPQDASWREYRVPRNLRFRVISCLRGKQLHMESWTRITQPGKNTGKRGAPTAGTSTMTPSSPPTPTLSKPSLSQPSLLGSGEVTTVEENVSRFKPLLTHLQPSQRPANWLDSLPRSRKQRKLTPSQWHGQWKDGDDRTLQPFRN